MFTGDKTSFRAVKQALFEKSQIHTKGKKMVLDIIISTIIGFFVWVVIYNIELTINGAAFGPSIFYYLWEDITWAFSKKSRLKYCKMNGCSEESLPGKLHLLIMHILIPFSPLVFILFYHLY